ncbi:helix-turn-helix transcriptional regulator [Phytoactinopolyspora mesophila]|uniref:Helix-turn-helix domain-containing protein n=1 Tax=Phytoactinopolyspora mesophila TaxID=2650750 RepID=A0A7K3M9Z7_9ACTN|nr:AraC family transcriptional regulator [Phytoactinopolyspora mesophila]NDL60145.1 helix-turn-helix domain-containing protein [Phytoactinopolyspora mesophila]
MYAERPSQVPHTVVWTGRADTHRQEVRVLPDGCMDLILARDALYVAGPDTTAHVTTWLPCTFTGLRFGSGVGPRVIGARAHELRDQLVPLADLWSAAEVRHLLERVHDAPDPAGVLESLAADRLRQAEPADALAGYAVRLLEQGSRVDQLADAVGLSSRQLYRRSLDAFGYGPKTLARILRFHRALRLGRAGRAPAEAAALSGYADQAHLSREVRSLSGVTFGELMA